jgi:hypothetical protein
MKKLLAIDLSGSATGWALFNLEDGSLLEFGLIEPEMPKGYTKMKYPKKAFYGLDSMTDQVAKLIMSKSPILIVLEEINSGISRIGNKVLAGAHWLLFKKLYDMEPTFLDIIKYMDSNGSAGWRPTLGIRLSDKDKLENKQIKILNKKNKSNKPVINWKTLVVRYVNSKFNLNLNKDNDPGTDGDKADSIALGYAYWSLLPMD